MFKRANKKKTLESNIKKSGPKRQSIRKLFTPEKQKDGSFVKLVQKIPTDENEDRVRSPMLLESDVELEDKEDEQKSDEDVRFPQKTHYGVGYDQTSEDEGVEFEDFEIPNQNSQKLNNIQESEDESREDENREDENQEDENQEDENQEDENQEDENQEDENQIQEDIINEEAKNKRTKKSKVNTRSKTRVKPTLKETVPKKDKSVFCQKKPCHQRVF